MNSNNKSRHPWYLEHFSTALILGAGAIFIVSILISLGAYRYPIFWAGVPVWVALAFLTFKIPERDLYRAVFLLVAVISPQVLAYSAEVLWPLRFEAIVYMVVVASIGIRRLIEKKRVNALSSDNESKQSPDKKERI